MARTVLDSQLQLLDAQLLVMASSTEDALRTSIAALAARDAEAANAVIDGDDDIDRQEREIESLCLKLLLTQQPVAGDLRRVSAGLKMVGDIERIADQAADICETSISTDEAFDARLAVHLRRMGECACDMVHDAVEAFVEQDLEKARAVVGRDDEVDALFDAVKTGVITTIQEGSGSANGLIGALMVAKYLERIGDHAQNVAEWVGYSLTGYYKGDLIG